MTADELRADIASDIDSANARLIEIGRLIAGGQFAAASIETDYLQGRIKSIERSQKTLAKAIAREAR